MPEPTLPPGGPVRTEPMPPWPVVPDEAIEEVTALLRSGRINYWTGDQGRRLEEDYAASLGRSFGIAVANGTVAIELALKAFGVGPGDEVIVPSRTFMATASAAVAVGATPVCCDIDPLSSDLTAETVAAAVTPRTRAVIPVHLGGWPVDMDPLLALADDRGLIVIEDCAQAHGGAYRGRPVGALGGHAATFSFCQDKIVPAGEGGLLVLDDAAAYERAWAYKEHGKSLARVREAAADPRPRSFNWLVESFGTNWRIDEMSAAVARAGLARLPEWHRDRTRNALRLHAGLAGIDGLTVPLPAEDTVHAFYRLYALVDTDRLAAGWTRDRFVEAVGALGVPCQYGSCAEIYRERAFVDAGLAPAERFPGASRAHEQSLAFFVHPTMSDADIDDTAESVRRVAEVAFT